MKSANFFVGIGNGRQLWICLPPGIDFKSADVSIVGTKRTITVNPHDDLDGKYEVKDYLDRGLQRLDKPRKICIPNVTVIKPFAQAWFKAELQDNGSWVITIPDDAKAPISRGKFANKKPSKVRPSAVAQVAETIQNGRQQRESEGDIPALICFGGRIGDVTINLPLAVALDLLRRY